MYKAKGVINFSGTTKRRTITFEPRLKKTALRCDIPWTIKNEMCNEACRADTSINWDTLNKIGIRHNYGDKYLNSDVTFENDEKLMRIVNTWNKVRRKNSSYLYSYTQYTICTMVVCT